jgi:propionate catabolism operon transcriptional regulator
MKLDPNLPPQIVAIGFRRINKMLQELAPAFHARAQVEVLEVGFDEAVARVRERQARGPVDVVVAAGSNGGYLRQHLDTPVVLVKVGGFDLLQALARARQLSAQAGSSQVGLVTFEGMLPDLSPYGDLITLGVQQRTYRTEDEALACVHELKALGVQVVVGSGLAADLADQLGLTGLFLYSQDAVREALDDAVEVARAARIEQAKRERLGSILAQLSDGVIAVDAAERIHTLNPAMAQLLGIEPAQWLGRELSAVCPDLSLSHTLRQAEPELEKVERVRLPAGTKALIVNRIPLVEQGVLTGAVLSCQDPISIQRVDRHIRTRIKPNAAATRYELAQFLGQSDAIAHVRQLAERSARSQATVLLVGESGTGKELIAQGIHVASSRRDMPFVAVNCAAVAESLLESELFGYEEGAFTGARRGGKIGLFEAAHNGTLFLDEVGEMPVSLQARLLRVLQEREVLRVGATEPTPVNVRVIAATHRDLTERVAQGLFRLDLYYRLNILRIEVPALRERLDDVASIAHALHAKVCARLRCGVAATQDLIDALIEQAPHHAWPGNVRELENLVERIVAYAEPDASGGTPTERLRAVLPELYAAAGAPLARALPKAPLGFEAPRLKAQLARSERERIGAVLAECGGDRGQAAQRLGISRTTLWRKLRPG